MKSPNVLLTEERRAKITDFGLSKVKQADTSKVTLTGGTVAWNAPEVFKGERVGPATDVYALGVIFWELAARQLPMKGMNMAAITMKVIAKSPPPPAP